MPLLVVGSVAFDSVQTPTETREDILGGSASYFSYAASYFTPVRLVSVVGEDWPDEYTKLFESRGIDTAGLQVLPGAKTFRWTGRYFDNMNDRETLDLQLNAFETFNPVLPEEFKRCQFLFLANGHPTIQLNVLEQCAGATLRVADTMDFYIRTAREELMTLLGRIDGLVLNDSEAKLLTGDENLVRAGHKVREMGPRFVVIKKGEHGAM
ncbi:MAG: sugar kinase, partial [Pirellulaceae bacterium]|nr:sugar kinase [Pirellulaceae bacterium]